MKKRCNAMIHTSIALDTCLVLDPPLNVVSDGM